MQPSSAKDTTVDRRTETPGISRRMFLVASTVLVGAAWGRLVPQTEATKRHPKHGGSGTWRAFTVWSTIPRAPKPCSRRRGPSALYTEAWNIANDELPFFYLHEFIQTSAADKTLQGYQTGSEGALAYRGGLPTAYIGA